MTAAAWAMRPTVVGRETAVPTTIGPVRLLYLNPAPAWTSGGPMGGRTMRLTGLGLWPGPVQLSELVANDHARQTEGPYSGVLALVSHPCPVESDFTGWYLLSDFELGADRQQLQAGREGVTSFALTATLLPARLRPVVPRSSTPLANAYNLPPVAMLADPLGAGWNPDPGGIPFFRAYDPRPRSRAIYAPHTGTVSRYMELRVADARLS